MKLDAIVVAESGRDVTEGIIPERLKLDGSSSSLQVVTNYLENGGRVVPPIRGDGMLTWWSAPKLNGIHLYNHLTKKGFTAGLINTYFNEQETFCDLIGQGPRAVIISSTFIRSKRMLRELVEDIRSKAPDIFIIVGGSFVYLSYHLLLRSREPGYVPERAKQDFLFLDRDDPPVDLYIISLKGEAILCEALKRIHGNRPLDDLPNSAYLEGKTYRFSQRVDDVTAEEEVPIDWPSLPDRMFSSGVMPLQASRGCPYRCAFCNFQKDPRLMSVKPKDQLTEEMKAVAKRGVRYVWFVDDNFRLGKSDLDGFCRHLLNEGVETRWMTMIRADKLEDVDVDLLRRSGCIEVQLGLESADPRILSNMNKRADPEVYARVVERLLEAGINCSCYFIFGFPGETNETAYRTRSFIRRIEHPELDGSLSWSLIPFSVVPMSPIYELDMRKRYGLEGYLRDWRHHTMDSEEAKFHAREALSELDQSSPIFRGDNLDMLLGLGARQRKRFLITRHRLSKSALKHELEKGEIVREFSRSMS